MWNSGLFVVAVYYADAGQPDGVELAGGHVPEFVPADTARYNEAVTLYNAGSAPLFRQVLESRGDSTTYQLVLSVYLQSGQFAEALALEDE